MQTFKNLKTATMVSILLASFTFLLPGAGISQADGYTRHFKPAHAGPASKHGYHNNTARHQSRQFTQRVVTTSRFSASRGAKQHHDERYCNANAKRHQRAGKRHMVHNSSFKHHQKMRQRNFKHQRHAQQHVRHNLGMFAALPGIIINIPL